MSEYIVFLTITEFQYKRTIYAVPNTDIDTTARHVRGFQRKCSDVLFVMRREKHYLYS